jgi:hypothetical protein
MHTHTGRQPHTTLLDLELESRKVGKYFFLLSPPQSRADTTSLESRPVLSGGGVCVCCCIFWFIRKLCVVFCLLLCGLDWTVCRRQQKKSDDTNKFVFVGCLFTSRCEMVAKQKASCRANRSPLTSWLLFFSADTWAAAAAAVCVWRSPVCVSCVCKEEEEGWMTPLNNIP